MMRRIFLSLFLVIFLSTCGQRDSFEPGVLASYSGGNVTIEDVDRELGFSPSSSRTAPPGEEQAWLDGLIRKVVLDRVLVERAREDGIDTTPGFLKKERQLRRENAAKRFFQQRPGDAPDLSEAALLDYFQANREQYKQEAERTVFHLFLRYGQDESKAALRGRIEALRDRIVRGEAFSELARQYSNSERRLLGGSLGTVKPGSFPADFDRVVFSLERGVPSKPVYTKDGAHLFLVETIVEAKEPELAEVRVLVQKDFLLETSRQYRENLLSELNRPDNLFMMPVDDFQTAMEGALPDTLLLSIGDFSLTKSEFERFMRDYLMRLGQTFDLAQSYTLLEDIRDQELIFQQSGDESSQSSPALKYALEQTLVEHYAERELLRNLSRDEAKLREHHRLHAMRFASPLRIGLKGWRVPLGDDPVALTAQLESMIAQLPVESARDEKTRNALSALGAEPFNLGLQTLNGLRKSNPSLARIAAQTDLNQWVPVLHSGERLVVAYVSERLEPAARPFEQSRNEVLGDVLQVERQALFHTWVTGILDDARFRLAPDRLTSYSGQRE